MGIIKLCKIEGQRKNDEYGILDHGHLRSRRQSNSLGPEAKMEILAFQGLSLQIFTR